MTPSLLPTATRIDPRRDPVTARTVCFVQTGAQPDQVDLFGISGLFIGTAPAGDWHTVPADAPPAAGEISAGS